MSIKQLFQDEDAVSPVIGVILMVAITVILAAVIGTFVLGLGDQVQSSAPNANFQFEYGEDWTGGDGKLTVIHNGGQDVDPDNVEVQVGSVTRASFNGSAWTSDTISTGDSELFMQNTSTSGAPTGTHLGGIPSAGDDVRVVWTSPSGDSSNTIGSSTVPN